jgi:hypothetical protein
MTYSKVSTIELTPATDIAQAFAGDAGAAFGLVGPL